MQIKAHQLNTTYKFSASTQPANQILSQYETDCSQSAHAL